MATIIPLRSLRTPERQTRKTSREAIIALNSMASTDRVGYPFVLDAVRISRPWNPRDVSLIPFSLAVGDAGASFITKREYEIFGSRRRSAASLLLALQSLPLRSPPSTSSFNLFLGSPPSILSFALLLQSPPSLFGEHLFATVLETYLSNAT